MHGRLVLDGTPGFCRQGVQGTHDGSAPCRHRSRLLYPTTPAKIRPKRSGNLGLRDLANLESTTIKTLSWNPCCGLTHHTIDANAKRSGIRDHRDMLLAVFKLVGSLKGKQAAVGYIRPMTFFSCKVNEEPPDWAISDYQKSCIGTMMVVVLSWRVSLVQTAPNRELPKSVLGALKPHGNPATIMVPRVKLANHCASSDVQRHQTRRTTLS